VSPLRNVTRHASNRRRTVDVVVPVEEAGAELAGVGERDEPVGELGQVLQGLKLRFGERVSFDTGVGSGSG
jgi:hypothetical protein